MLKSFAYDIEVYENFFCSTFLDIETQDKEIFVIYKTRNDGEKLKEFLNREILLIGYNNIAYDGVILNYIINNIESENLLKNTFELSSSIVTSKGFTSFRKLFNSEDIKYKQLDLMKIYAFDRYGISLKQCAINLRWKRIQDLPLLPDHKVTPDEISIVLDYNLNDVLITFELYKASLPLVELRRKLSVLFDVDLTSASDSKMANVLLENFYSKQKGVNIPTIKGLRTPRFQLTLADCIGKNIEFKTNKLNRIKNEIANTVVRQSNNFKYSKKIEFGGIKYEIGVGGLHSVDTSSIFESSKDTRIVDCDASSFYPSIMIINEIKPDHLDNAFIDVLKKITKERMQSKKLKDETKADGLKITINSIFGKLGSNTFWLYDPKALLTVTISGQLYLLMLIESLVLNNIQVISANTDGIVSIVPRELETKYLEACKEWENKTGFDLEFTDYSLYARSDVNNYITKKASGETKTKGRYLTEVNLKKAYRHPVVAKCLFEYFVNNVPVEDTLNESKDIFDFCISQKTGGDFILEYHRDDSVTKLQKNNRFFISNSGGKLIKRHMIKNTTIGLFVEFSTSILNDYDDRVPFGFYDINYDFYFSEAMKYITPIEESKAVENPFIEFIDESEDYMPIQKNSPDKEAFLMEIDGMKRLQEKVIDNILRINKEFTNGNFFELLVFAENENILSAKFLEFIKINYFSKHGKNKKLSIFFEEFTKGKNKYKHTLSEKSKVKRLEELEKIWKELPDEKLSIKDQIDAEIKILGRIQSKFDGLNKRYAYVLGTNTKYSPRLQLYGLSSGTQVEVKIQKRFYDISPIVDGDIILTKRFEKKPSVKMIDGKFEEIPNNFTWWLQSYRIINNPLELSIL